MVSGKFSNLKWVLITGYVFYIFFVRKHNDFHTHKILPEIKSHLWKKEVPENIMFLQKPYSSLSILINSTVENVSTAN